MVQHFVLGAPTAVSRWLIRRAHVTIIVAEAISTADAHICDVFLVVGTAYSHGTVDITAVPCTVLAHAGTNSCRYSIIFKLYRLEHQVRRYIEIGNPGNQYKLDNELIVF